MVPPLLTFTTCLRLSWMSKANIYQGQRPQDSSAVCLLLLLLLNLLTMCNRTTVANSYKRNHRFFWFSKDQPLHFLGLSGLHKGLAFQYKPQLPGCPLVWGQNSAEPVQLLISCGAFQQCETVQDWVYKTTLHIHLLVLSRVRWRVLICLLTSFTCQGWYP